MHTQTYKADRKRTGIYVVTKQTAELQPLVGKFVIE